MIKEQLVAENRLRQGIVMLILIISGETIFLLPFILPRIFRPTILEVFGITNFELGTAFSVYGFVALVAYFAGGPIADRFSARKLMAIALFSTSLGAIILSRLPNVHILRWLYAFWGLSTILLFWAAMLRYTRIWGGRQHQGSAYGLLEAGRGLVAAILASLSVIFFSGLLPADSPMASLAERKMAMVAVIWAFGGFVFLVGILVWFIIPDQKSNKSIRSRSREFSLPEISQVLKKPVVWLNAFIVLCAYVGYKCTDDFSLLAYDAFNYNEIDAAQIGTISFWMRPMTALIAGFIADRISSSKMIIIGFIISLMGSSLIATGLIAGMSWVMLVLVVASTSCGIYAVRGIYFALFNEAKIPIYWTGTAIGIISVVGFMPDIFMGPLMGYFIDENPGILGHQYVFAVMVFFSLVGLTSTLAFRKISNAV